MKCLVWSTSRSFITYVSSLDATQQKIVAASTEDDVLNQAEGFDCIIIHLPSAEGEVQHAIQELCSRAGLRVCVASNTPSVEELLSFTQWPIQAYFHSYMAEVHYQQMYRMLELGLRWFHPELLNGVIALARQSVTGPLKSDLLAPLSKREREIALLIGEGLSNNLISKRIGITERTVKAHISSIFQKLGYTDRVGLAIAINRGR